jgi:hypothetical protein
VISAILRIWCIIKPYEIYDSDTQDNAIAQYWKNTISKFFVNYTKNCLIKKAKKG